MMKYGVHLYARYQSGNPKDESISLALRLKLEQLFNKSGEGRVPISRTLLPEEEG